MKQKQKKKRRVEEIDEVLIKREATLLELVKKLNMSKIIVFFNEKKQCEKLTTLFAVFGLKAAQVQGNLTQSERMEAIEKF